METDIQGFHEDEQFSTNSLLSSDEVMKYQLRILESRTEDSTLWQEHESILNENVMGREDFQQIMSDWQTHVSSLQILEPEDVDVPLDLLGSSGSLLGERSPILLKALNCSPNKLENIEQPICDLQGIKKEEPLFENGCYQLYPKIQNDVEKYFDENPNSEILGIKKESLFDDSAPLFSKIENDQRYFCENSVCIMPDIKKDPVLENDQNFLNGNVKSEPTVVRKLTLVNGEKEILGKNIIELHSLNVIKENPDQNCQITSTVINGKKYKIIIIPKSQKLQSCNEEKAKKSPIKKLSKSNSVLKFEPKEDEIISEMRNGNYDVPILGNDTLLSWDMAWFDNTWDNTSDNILGDIDTGVNAEPPNKVPPLKIKLQKAKKCKKKKAQSKSDEEIDVETVGDKEDGRSGDVETGIEPAKEAKKSESIKKSLPKEMVHRIESLKRKKNGRIPLVQVIPKRKNLRSGTRMQDAAVAISRNKLLKIVSGGGTVQLDHDYCRSSFKSFEAPQTKKTESEVDLTEKNPKKDSGMESGDVSDASEDPQTPENAANLNSFQQLNTKLMEQAKNGKRNCITKVAADLFRAANVITSATNVNTSDVVKTLVVSNGTKALTNDTPQPCVSESNSDKCDIVPSGGSSEIFNSNDAVRKSEVEGDESKVSCNENPQVTQRERPKKKLKLEEYLSRRNGKLAESRADSSANNEDNIPSESKSSSIDNVEEVSKAVPEEKAESKLEKEKVKEEEEEEEEEKGREDSVRGSNKGRKSRRYRSQRSSSTSSGERDAGRRDRERSPSTKSFRRETRRDCRSRHKYSSERRRSFWSRSLSRSSSRESSSSSDRSGGRRKHRVGSLWYRRRSGSRSKSRERSRSRNRSYSNRRRQNRYYNRDFYRGRSRSPYRSYSVREKQRQIEERRVIYIGRIEEGMTNAKLRERFSVFGPIVDISLHFREYGDNYGFVTYAYKDDAYDAVEHGNDDPNLARYDLCFGGRRGFCKERYADLDGMPTSYSGFKDRQVLHSPEESFDLLLKKAQAKLKNRMNKNKES